jgi:hypothetical protein
MTELARQMRKRAIELRDAALASNSQIRNLKY